MDMFLLVVVESRLSSLLVGVYVIVFRYLKRSHKKRGRIIFAVRPCATMAPSSNQFALR